MNQLKSPLTRFRIIAFLEGMSFILLVGIAVPLKYNYGYEHATRELGMVHGILFILYILSLGHLKSSHSLSWLDLTKAFVAALLPFGTFIAEYYWFKKIEVSVHK